MLQRFPAVLLGAALVFTSAAPAGAAEVDFTGIVALSGCSGSVVRVPSARPGDRALVLSNGHCLKLMGSSEVWVDQASTLTFTLLNRSGTGTLAELRAERLLYATMSGTDVSLFRLRETYARIESYGSRALELSPGRATEGIDIRVVSGYWKRIYSCRLDGFAFRLREDRWTWNDSLRYTPSCDTIGGTSGSPVVDFASGKVVGVNNTTNENGERCTTNNPCEVDPTGAVTVRHGIAYGQQTYSLVPCVGAGSTFNLHAQGCAPARPWSSSGTASAGSRRRGRSRGESGCPPGPGTCPTAG